MLTAQQRRTILGLARRAIESHFEPDRHPEEPANHPFLKEQRSLFVSLHRGEELRGCIGTLEPEGPLSETLARIAVAAATRDPRFSPLLPSELPRVRIQVTLISSPYPIAGPEEIEIGRHGLLVTEGLRRGVLLPQVATEHGWNAATFLSQTCLKAGLDADAWKRIGKGDVRIFAFRGEIAEEEGPA